MDVHFTELSEAIGQAESGDEVWNLCFKELNKYGVSSMFYGVIPIKKEVDRVGLTQACFFRTNHPKKWIELFGEISLLDNELSTEKMVDDISRDHFIWHDEVQWEIATDAQREQSDIEKSLGMNIGVTLNLANDNEVAMGIGLAMADLTVGEFSSMWSFNSAAIFQISRILSDYYESTYSSEFVRLTKKEKTVLEWVSAGYSQREIAEKLCITNTTMEFHSRNIRTKLRSQSLEYAFLKARNLKIV